LVPNKKLLGMLQEKWDERIRNNGKQNEESKINETKKKTVSRI
jgi:hypothetical protein